MPVDFSVKGFKNMESNFKRGVSAYRSEAEKQMLALGLLHERTWKKLLSQRGDTSFGLRARSGLTRASIRTKLFVPFNWRAMSVKIGSPSVVVAAHEGGATVAPKNRTYLTIPLGGAKTKGGSVRGRARQFADTFVIRSKNDNLLIVRRRGKQGVEPLFLLRKEPVRLRARRFTKTVRRARKADVERIFGKKVGATASRVAGGKGA